MAIVDDNNNNEQEFINSLAVDNIKNESDNEGGEKTKKLEEQQEVTNDNSNTTVNAYLPSKPSLSPTIYAKSTMIPSSPPSSITLTTTAVSGATHDMSGIKLMFEEIFPRTNENGKKPFALLGDGTTTCTIEGYSYHRLNGLPIQNLQLFVPALKNSHLTSILQHSKYKGCYFHSKNKKTTLAFPSAIINANCKGEITIKIDPITTTCDHANTIYMFDEQYTTSASDKITKVSFYPAVYNKFIKPDDAKQVSETVKIKKLDKNAKIPKHATDGSLGYDLHSPISTIISAGQTIKIPQKFALSTPSGLYPRIADQGSIVSKGVVVH